MKKRKVKITMIMFSYSAGIVPSDEEMEQITEHAQKFAEELISKRKKGQETA